MPTNLLLIILIFCWIGFAIKGLKTNISIIQTIKWIKYNNTKPNYIFDIKNKYPYIILVIPVLREQRVIKETVKSLISLGYPNSLLKVIVVTTEKEISQRNKDRGRVESLIHDLSNGVSQNLIAERYLGLFTLEQLTGIYEYIKNFNPTAIAQYVYQIYDTSPSTIDIVTQLVKELNIELTTPILYGVHYPYIDGVMAHQLNYVAKHLNEILDCHIDPNNTYFGIYNADSSPNAETLNYIGYDALQYRQIYGQIPEVYQQSSLFTRNFFNVPKGISGYILKSSSIFQTRWTLGNEIPSIRRAYDFYQEYRHKELSLFDKIFRDKLMYCIGHGLFVRYDILKSIGFFSEKTVNEDIAFGFSLCMRRIPVKPIPVLENTDNPETVHSLITQKGTWFWGSLQYPTYPLLTLDNYNSTRAWLLMLRGLPNIGNWLFSSISILILFCIPVFLHSLLLLGISVFSFLIYSIWSYFLIFSNWSLLYDISNGYNKKPSIIEQYLISFFSIVYLFLSSFGPARITLDCIIWLFLGKKPEKRKTER